MNADDVLNTKAEVFKRAFGFDELNSAYALGDGPTFAPLSGTEAADAIEKGRRAGALDARDLIALGTMLPGNNNMSHDGALAILIQKQRLAQHPIVEEAVRAARGQAKIIYTGPVRRFGGGGSSPSRPLRIGVSIAHYGVTAGTLGCFVRKRVGGGIGILSNNHVLADTNRARAGDIVLQPGKADGGRLAIVDHLVAQLHHFVPIDFAPNAINWVDAAYALLLYGIPYVADHVGDLGAGPDLGWPVGQTEALLGTREAVKKWGRTTGLTRGEVVATNVDNLLVNLVFGSAGGFARFNGQISIEGNDGRFSAPGDSGSVVFSDNDQPVGLLFAGSETGGRRGRGLTYATPIDTVLEKLDVDLYTGV